MFEFFSWIASILAVTWARKQDVARAIDDARSRREYLRKLLQRNKSFSQYLQRFNNFLNQILGTPANTFAFCVMLALMYSSAVFLFNLAFSTSILDADKLPAWQSKLVFAAIIGATVVVYGVARINHRSSRFFTRQQAGGKPRNRRYRKIWDKYIVGHAIGAVYYSIAVLVVYRSYELFLFSLVISGLAAYAATTRLNVQQQFDQYRWNTVAGAALGGHGLLVAILFFAASEVRWPIYVLVAGATALSAFAAWLAFPHSICIDHQVTHKEGRKGLSVGGRPALYVGFYCSRAPGSFCFAVGTLLLICHLLTTFLAVPQQITVPASIILTSAIFLAGATTVAGAGAFAISTMIIVTGFLAVFERDLIFTKWSYLVIFWFIFPLLNAFSDFVRWQIVRAGIRYRLRHERANSVALLIVDLLIAMIVIVLFVYASVYAISTYNHVAVKWGYPTVVNIKPLLEKIHGEFWANGVWLLLMIATMLLPTFCNLAIYLSAGSIDAVPMQIREHLARELQLYPSQSILGRDWLSWRLAAVDSFAGVIFFVGVLAMTGYLVVLVAPAFGELLYIVASIALHESLPGPLPVPQ
jgi:hypothetical protein